MSAEIPTKNPEQETPPEDNARKFVLDALSPEVLAQYDATECMLITDWLEISETNEKKLAYKIYKDGRPDEIFLIEKITHEDGRRTVPEKKALAPDDYDEQLKSSIRQVKKVRYEFNYIQNGIKFKVKYDEFIDSELRILEVDAESGSDVERASFKPEEFLNGLKEVTGKLEYYGHRVTTIL